jgi:tetratricopeptide (TPR) repeat protein
MRLPLIFLLLLSAGAAAADSSATSQIRSILASVPSSTQDNDLTAIAKAHAGDPSIQMQVGTAYLKLGNYGRAKPYLENAAKDQEEAASPELLFNLGLCDLKFKNTAPRSVKLIIAYFEKPDVAPNEPLQNLLGSLLFQMAHNDRQRKSALFKEGVQIYLAQDDQLEALRTTGEVRWGSSWINDEKKRDIDAQRSDLFARIREKRSDLDRANGEVAQRQRALNDALRHPIMNGQANRVARLRDDLNNAARSADQVNSEVSQLRKQLPLPNWPDSYDPLLPADLAGKPPTQIVAVDTAAPTPLELPTETPTSAPVDLPPEVDPPVVTTPPSVQPPVVHRPVKPVDKRPASEKPSGTSIFDFGD